MPDKPARYFAPIDFRTRFPALDGIRAIAILAVFADHYGGGSHGGLVLNLINVIRTRGWLGVDLFFVLSGFLITGILYDTQSDSQYFKRFFARRSLRIFPIYYFVFAVVLILTPFMAYQWHAGHLLFLIYMGNWLANHNFKLYEIESAKHSGMRVTISHFWSLCVEEQFYLLWPPAVYFLRKRRSIVIAGISVSVLALLLRIALLVETNRQITETWAVRTLPFRMDSLLMGGILALLLRTDEADRIQRSCKWLFLGSGSAVAVLFWLSPDYDSPWLLTIGFTLIALASTGLIGSTLRVGGPAYRLFHLKPLRILGKYSYGFYIYHLLFRWQWIKLLVFLQHRLHSIALAGIVALTTNFIVTFLVAKISYDFFESRFLRFKKHFEYDSEIAAHKHAFVTR